MYVMSYIVQRYVIKCGYYLHFVYIIDLLLKALLTSIAANACFFFFRTRVKAWGVRWTGKQNW